MILCSLFGSGFTSNRVWLTQAGFGVVVSNLDPRWFRHGHAKLIITVVDSIFELVTVLDYDWKNIENAFSRCLQGYLLWAYYDKQCL